MASAVQLQTHYSAQELRRLAKGSDDVNQSRRLLSLAAVLEGMSRADAARIGGMSKSGVTFPLGDALFLAELGAGCSPQIFGRVHSLI